MSIGTQYNVNLNWLLAGVAAEDGTTYEDEFEKRLIEVFRNLDDYDKTGKNKFEIELVYTNTMLNP